jgi:hypothetical protein
MVAPNWSKALDTLRALPLLNANGINFNSHKNASLFAAISDLTPDTLTKRSQRVPGKISPRSTDYTADNRFEATHLPRHTTRQTVLVTASIRRSTCTRRSTRSATG